LQRKIHDIEGIAHTWGNLGNIAKKRNNYPEARKLYYRQLKIELAIQDLDGAGRARFNLAMINRELKMYKRAMTQLICAKDLFTKCNAQYYLDLCKQQESELLALASGKQT
jgi:tetratricopeptide (TPR) repeat protein